MKIAMMVRGYLPIPRPTDMIYAPIDLALAAAEGLAARGHDVTLFAPNGSKVKPGSTVQIETLNLRPLAHTYEEFRALLSDSERVNHYMPELWDTYLAREMLARAAHGRYQLVHFHHPEVALDIARYFPNVPIVYTIHDPVFPWYKEMFELYQTHNQHFISISNNQRRDAPDLPYVDTVYNGIDPQHWPPSTTPEDYLLCAGRIVPEKGMKEAIQVAKQTGHRLLIIGPATPGPSQDYFDQYIKPQLDDQILYLGFVERSQMWRYYQKAKALLTPVQWEEPFGLTSIEAMACGTPVISLNRGAAQEIIVHGKTGFIVDSITEMITAVGNIHQIDRNTCREHVKAHFSTSNMADGYEAAYRKILRGQTATRKVARDLDILRARLREMPKKLRKNLLSKSVSDMQQLPLGFENELAIRPIQMKDRRS
jgi:glycosyltransferase involved in cell wall biosynthesis